MSSGRGPAVDTTWQTLVDDRVEAIRAAGRWRTIRTLHTAEERSRLADGTAVVEFASNDYLGLSQHPAVIDAAIREVRRSGTGSGASRLIVGSRPVHDELEVALAQHHRRDASLLFSTGFQANLGVITALAAAAPNCVIVSDELNHASIIDGARLARAEVVVYPHADTAAVAELLDAHRGRPALVVTDSVFSMDGDAAPLDELATICRDSGALLVVDEAHAVLAPPPPPDAVVVGTLSKTLGSLGGFVAASAPVIDLCRNTARSFIFTTATTPADAAAALAALEVLRSDEGAALQQRLRSNIDLLAPDASSPILPVMLGTEERALAVTDALLDRGLLVPAIRPPTVPDGTCRLRVAVSATHRTDDLVALRDALVDLGVDPIGQDRTWPEGSGQDDSTQEDASG